MSLLTKIKNYAAPTATEEVLIDYIFKHGETVIYDSIHKLAEQTGISPAAIVRFSKKMGYHGFSDFKLALAADFAMEKGEKAYHDLSQQISYGDTLETVIQKSRLANLDVVEQTYRLIEPKELTRAVTHLKSARRIFLFGIGASGVCCDDLAQKFSRIGLEPVYYADSHAQVASSIHITAQDAVIGISYSGDKREITSAIAYGRSQGAHIIALTQHNNNPLASLADSMLILPSLEHDLRVGAIASRNATLIYTDLLYLGFLCNDFDSFNRYLEKLKQTRKIVKEFYNYT
ncbi:MAG: MurR/RpiR family transcriptional regulator [Oscillospiraceae bacterium]|nr:MurR/RpiR family transcriptional regulator [Oscillospiraceae bacterium]